MIRDVLIVGGGPAGLAAAIYASRRRLSTLIVTQDIGGQAGTTEEIENYPGVDPTGGPSLMLKFKSQAERFGTVFAFGRVEKLEALTLADGQPGFQVTSDREMYLSRTLILAYGLTHRHLNVPGERELAGRGVSYCATCDAPLVKGQRVAVIGGGNAALDAALMLADHGCPVTLIHRGTSVVGEAPLIARLKHTPLIELRMQTVVTAVRGTDRVSGLTLAPVADPTATQELAVNSVFVAIGFDANPTLVEGLVDLDVNKQIIISPNNETSRPGIFAAGDITTLQHKQIVISAGEGAKAALAATHYLTTRSDTRSVANDWGFLPH